MTKCTTNDLTRRILIRLTTVLFFISAPLAFAAPASQVAWTPDLLKAIKMANPENGKQLAENCAACHGGLGISSNPEFPSLAGQLATYTFKQLQDYQNGTRNHMMMSPIAKNLKRQDMINLAAWFASLMPGQQTKATNDRQLRHAKELVYKGDGKRTIPPCFVCHGDVGQGEKMAIPALAGQQMEYLKKTLLEYKQQQRSNDIYSRMRLIAKQLSEREIDELSRYYRQK